MKNLKTYEGFFDFLKRKKVDNDIKNSEDDNIALEYIRRLKRIKGISPYDITSLPDRDQSPNFTILKFIIDFEDTPINIFKITHNYDGFDQRSRDLLVGRGY